MASWDDETGGGSPDSGSNAAGGTGGSGTRNPKGPSGVDGNPNWQAGAPVPGHPGYHYNDYGGWEADSAAGGSNTGAGSSATDTANKQREDLLGDYSKYNQGSPLPKSEVQNFLKYIVGKESLAPRSDSFDRIIDALHAVGVKADKYLYGSTPSNNEISIDGEKYKLISGESGGSPSWYWGGNDSAGGTDANGAYFRDFTQPFTGTSAAPYAAPAPFSYPTYKPLTLEQLANEPGYAFGKQEGLGVIQNNAAAHGSYFTPTTTNAATKFAEDYATTKSAEAEARNFGQFTQGLGQALDIYGVNNQTALTASDVNYQRAWQEYKQAIDTYFGNQDRTFNRGLSLSQLGANAAAAGG